MKVVSEKLWFKQFINIFFFKSLSIVLSFLIPSLVINRIGIEKYGVWSVLLTIISWLTIVDVGFGNSLRFKLSVLFVEKNYKQIRYILNSAFLVFGFIVLLLGSIVLLCADFINFQTVFNTNMLGEQELKLMFSFSAILVLVLLWLNLVNPLLYVTHKSHWIAISNFLSTLVTFLLLFYSPSGTPLSLFHVSIFFIVPQVLASLGLGLYFFLTNRILLERSRVSLRVITSLVKNGGSFFLIQIAGLIVFSTDKFLISYFFGPKYVTSFDVSLKYFSALFLLHTVVSTPLWALYSESFKKGDVLWMKRTMDEQKRYFVLFVLAGFAMLFLSNILIKFWISEEFIIDANLSLSILMYTLVMIWNNIFATFLNGIGEERIQLKPSFIAIISNISLAFLFIKVLNLGYISIIVSSVISSLIPAIILPLRIRSYLITANREISNA